MQDRRDRRVMFRLSDEEYDRLQQMCHSMRCRSFSELVRAAVHSWIDSGAGRRDAYLEQRLDDCERRIAALSAQVQRMLPVR
ncbi:MAG: ribbon-helix-helix protein, CopG family [Bryobacteraceae bacterium]|nr:ribbon-helix-helix protein, CopG family [Bryobacteraceae bacterium]